MTKTTKKIEKLMENYKKNCEMYCNMGIDGYFCPTSAVRYIREKKDDLHKFICVGYGYEFFSEKEFTFVTDFLMSDDDYAEKEVDRLYENWDIASENYEARQEIESRKKKAV